MKLTRFTDYSLRVLIYLSLQADDQRITISIIANNFKIPRNHLVKIINKLEHLNYIQTTRGKKGGVRLGKIADEIYIGEVVRQMEPTLEVINCEAPTPCPMITDCMLKPVLVKATNAFIDVLNQYTIADIAKSRDQLKILLNF